MLCYIDTALFKAWFHRLACGRGRAHGAAPRGLPHGPRHRPREDEFRDFKDTVFPFFESDTLLLDSLGPERRGSCIGKWA